MTPLFRHPEPDDRPTPREIVGAVLLAALTLAVLWIVGAINTNLPTR